MRGRAVSSQLHYDTGIGISATHLNQPQKPDPWELVLPVYFPPVRDVPELSANTGHLNEIPSQGSAPVRPAPIPSRTGEQWGPLMNPLTTIECLLKLGTPSLPLIRGSAAHHSTGS